MGIISYYMSIIRGSSERHLVKLVGAATRSGRGKVGIIGPSSHSHTPMSAMSGYSDHPARSEYTFRGAAVLNHRNHALHMFQKPAA